MRVFLNVRLWNTVLISAGNEWSNCFTLKDISLPENPYIGLTAMTGDVSDAHEYVFFVFPLGCSRTGTYLTAILAQHHLCRDVVCYPLRC